MLKDVDVLGLVQKNVLNIFVDSDEALNFRSVMRSKALEVWRDYPLLGVGPGMFGGNIAERAGTHLYNEYNIISGIN